MAVTLNRPKKRRATFHGLRVADVQRLTDQSVAIGFEIPDELAGEFLRFQPGQHLTIRAEVNGEDLRRSYSCCISRGHARRTSRLRVASARVPGGAMSTWLNENVEVGQVLQVMTPLGSFTCPTRPDSARHHVAFAAGSGITPVLSLIATALEEEPASRVTLFYGNRRTDSIMFLEELMDLKNAYADRFTLINVLSREVQDVELFSGRLDRERITRLLEIYAVPAEVDEFYLCGPFGMVETARTVLAQAGADPEHVHHEVFHVDELGAAVPPTVGLAEEKARDGDEEQAPYAEVTVTLDGRTTTIPMRTAGESILAATLRERPDAPFSCTGGICGTCRARVVDGEVRMDRNYALEPDEIAAGVVLACQSHPVTERVRLDYDA